MVNGCACPPPEPEEEASDWLKPVLESWIVAVGIVSLLWAALLCFLATSLARAAIDRGGGLRELAARALGLGREKAEGFVSELVTQRRLDRSHRLALVAAVVLPPCLVARACDMLTASNWWDSAWLQHLWVEMTIVSLVCMGLLGFPRHARRISPDIVHTFVLLGFAVRICIFSTVNHFEEAWAYMALVRVIIPMSFGSPRLTLVLNVLFAGCEILMWRLHANVVGRAIATVVVVCALALATDGTMKAEAYANIIACTSEREAQLHMMLSSMCDAVVHVDTDLAIIEPSPKFEAMLNLSRSCLCRSFVDFVHHNCRQRFRRVIASPDARVGSMRLQLVWLGRAVQATIWHAAVLDLQGRRNHVLAILLERGGRGPGRALPLREQPSEPSEPPESTEPTSPAEPARPGPGSQPGSEPHAEAVGPGLPGDAELGRDEPEQLLAPAPAGGPGDRIKQRFSSEELVVQLQAGDPEMVIHDFSAGLRLLLGPAICIGARLATFVENGHVLSSWVAEMAEPFAEGDDLESAEVSNCKAYLRLHTSRGPVCTQCSVVFPMAMDGPAAPEGRGKPVYITFRITEHVVSL